MTVGKRKVAMGALVRTGLAVAAAVAVAGAARGQEAKPAHPDFSGVWQIDFPFSLAGREGMRPTDGKPTPKQPWTDALHQSGMRSNRPGNEPWPPNNQRCLVAGAMRAMKGNFPWRLIQKDDKIVLLFEEDGRFTIWPMRDKPEAIEPRPWDGSSAARWDGDTLVVEVSNFNGKTPFPHGLLHTQLLKLTHRIRLIDNGAKLEDLITIDDPGAFTRPFQVRSVFSRQPADYKLRDYRCAENNKDLPGVIDWWTADWGPD